MDEKTVYLIDGSSFLYRFFFAIRNLSRNGMPTGAVFGFARMLLDIDKENPEYIAVLFDTKAKTFRADLFESYKQNRPKMPDELSVQIEPVKELINCFGITIIEKDGFEADDLIATLAEKMKKEFKVVVLANDKDLLQLVEDDSVVIYDPVKKIYYNEEAVYKKLGVYPSQVADYLALIGDSIDNIPGIKSIGPKTAASILKNYKNCNEILDNVNNLKPKIKDAILSDGNLLLYKKLTTIDKNVEIDITPEDIKRKPKQTEKIRQMFLRFGFKSLLNNIKSEEKGKSETFSCDIIYKENEQHYRFDGKNSRTVEPSLIEQAVAVYDLKDLLWAGFQFTSTPFDIKLACYLLNSDSSGMLQGCFEYADKELDYKVLSAESFAARLAVAEKGAKKLIEKNSLSYLLNEVETPLSYVLYEMEKVGLKIDTDYLYKFKNELTDKQKHMESSIYALAGEEFNINSTKELQKILFEKMGIKPIKKTKTGYSTDSETLQELSKKYEIAELIIKYREIAKIVSTYIVPFIKKADKNSRLHTTFNQTLTSTGRLSSSNPNLQNLPANEDEIHAGIRRAVIAQEGYKLICADYSQIELRILAHFSKDRTLIEVFNNNGDIHTQTAVKLFGVHESMVDHNLRRTAKVINFGILYGMGYVSLSKTLGIKKSKAKEIIEKYFERFKDVQNFISNTIDSASKNGYVETFFKRRRYFANLNSSNERLAGFERRAAVNAVIQGTAADIIKIAMVRLDKKLKNIDAKLVMQVHDELLIEANEEAAEQVKEITKDVMENVVKFDVPLLVNIKVADNWLEAK